MPKRGALVGFGQVAEKAHLPAFRASRSLQLVAVAEESPARREAAAAALPGARIHHSLEALLAAEPQLDFAVIATPPFLHARQSQRALEAGLHVLCEKPLAFGVDELDSLTAAAQEAGRALFTVHNWAHSPQWVKIAELVAAGAIGDVRHAELHVLRTRPAAGALPGDWRTQAGLAGGGILVDHGWHNLYLLWRLVAEEAERATARWHLPETGGAEDEVSLFLEFPEATALMHLSWRAPHRHNGAVVYGSRGRLELRDDHLRLSGEGSTQRFDFAQKLSAGSAHPDWMAGLLCGFEAAMADPRTLGNLDEASFCLRTIHRAYQGLRRGKSPMRELLAQ